MLPDTRFSKPQRKPLSLTVKIIIAFFICSAVIAALLDDDTQSQNVNITGTSSNKRVDTTVKVAPKKDDTIAQKDGAMYFDNNGNPVNDGPQKNLTYLPGFMAADLYVNLKEKGFGIKKDLSGEFCYWDCSKQVGEFEYTVRIGGKEPDKIDGIEATVVNYSDEATNDVAKTFLSYIASVNYDGANTPKAQEWVIKNIGTSTKTNFGGVAFQIIANDKISPRTLSLIISVNTGD